MFSSVRSDRSKVKIKKGSESDRFKKVLEDILREYPVEDGFDIPDQRST